MPTLETNVRTLTDATGGSSSAEVRSASASGFGPTTAPAAESADADADRSFVLAFPLASTHAGIYLGNGNVGVIVWGTPDKLILTCLPACLR